MQTGAIVGAGCALFLGILIFGIAFWTVLIMLLWNFLFVPAFHVGPIDWGQALAGAIVLSIVQSIFASGRS